MTPAERAAQNMTLHQSEIVALGEQVAALTAERDEAVAQVNRSLWPVLAADNLDLAAQVATLTAERDEARAQHGTDVHNLMQRQLEVLHERDEAQTAARTQEARVRDLRDGLLRLRSEVHRIAEEGLRDHQPYIGKPERGCSHDAFGRMQALGPRPWSECPDVRRYSILAARCDPGEAAQDTAPGYLDRLPAVEAQEEGT